MYITDDGVLRYVDINDLTSDGKLVIPSNVKEIGERFLDDRACSFITSVQIPNSVVKISDSAFCGSKLEEIYIPDTVKEMGKNIFAHCVRLSKVRLPNGLKVIPEGMFNDASIDDLIIPDSVDIIGPFAFNACYIGGNIVLSKNLREIQKYAFSGSTLNYIDIPKSVELIDGGAFLDCSYLKNISLSKGLIKIKSEAFNGCSNLQEIEIPDTVVEIGSGAFQGCKDLKKVKLSKKLKYVDSLLFYNSGIESIELPEIVEEIKNGAFGNCDRLKQVQLPNGLKVIGDNSFENCYKLQSINIPNNVIKIGDVAFGNCQSLQIVDLPSSLKIIGERSFEDCKKLGLVSFNYGVETIGEKCFYGCKNLTKIELPKSVQKVQYFAFPITNKGFVLKTHRNITLLPSPTKKPIYLYKQNDDRFIVSSKNIENSIRLDYSKQLNLGAIIALYEQKEQFFKFIDKASQEILILSLYTNLPYEKFIDFYLNADVKFFNKVYNVFVKKLKNDENRLKNISELCKIVYNLGGFEGLKEEVVVSKNGEKTVRTYNAQKVSEFLIEAINSGILDPNQFYEYFGEMNFDENKADFTRLFLNKESLKQMIDYNNNHPLFISYSYNDLKKIQDRNKSNKGSQRQLKVTFDMLVDYANKRKFNNQTEENEQIAHTVSRFFIKQSTFDSAVKIMKEKEELGVADSILNKQIKEEDVFESINNHLEIIKEKASDTLEVLVELMTKEFTYEWLSKNDPYNLVLGKLCDCCAHLEGEGVGIMRASIIHPNVQNLVIRDKTGEIVAKSTLYINPDEGYGVFNTIAVCKDALTFVKPKIIYQKFKKAIDAFAKQYNLENPDKPLKILTVGESMNKLIGIIKENDKKSDVLYRSIYYGDYAMNKSAYEGDSFTSQYILWEEKENGR